MISLPLASPKGAAVCFKFGLVPFPSVLHVKPNVITEGDKLGAEHKAKTRKFQHDLQIALKLLVTLNTVSFIRS